MSLPTPYIAHLTEDDYEHVYEPAEDSFILLDALEAEAEALRHSQPVVCVEIGSGSGIASVFLSKLLGPGSSLVISTDINLYACGATIRTAEANQVSLDPVRCSLMGPLIRQLGNKVDVLIFNPPYVPTATNEMLATQYEHDIGGAWAGGQDGMAVTDILLDQLPLILAPGGRLYLVAIHQNRIQDIGTRMALIGLQSKEILRRRAGRELLCVVRIHRPL
ncbi:hypothetical protein IAT38_004765 [Cryptococcus sp. DSM 104549]